jgi:hypothetical protein
MALKDAEGASQEPPLALSLRLARIQALTSFVGSWRAQYKDIHFSGGQPASAGLHAEAGVNFTAGKFLTLSNKVSRGNKDTPEYLATDDYVQSMGAAVRMEVILSDSVTRQHWLADGASVILHFCRAWLSQPHPGFAPEGVADKLWSCQDAGAPSESLAVLTSVANRELELYISHVKHVSIPTKSGAHLEAAVERQWYLLQDLAHRFFKWIEQIRDRASKSRHSADIDLIRQGKQIIGFEFMDLLRGDHRIEPCVLELGAGAATWLPYARSTDTVHIFGSGFGKLVQPILTTGDTRYRCGQQWAAPRDADYLVAPLSVLKETIERFRHTSTCVQLSHGLHWWNVDEAFRDCECQRLRPSRRCTSLVKKLHGARPEESRTQTSARLPMIFARCPTAAIIMGYEPQLLVKNLLVANNSRDARQQRGTTKDTRQQKRLPSDSGYASNVGHSSHDSPSSSLISEEPSPEEFRIRGAASETGGRKLTKRRKTGG